MRIAIVGPGAMGLLLSGLLHRAGAIVTIIDYCRERANQLNKNGVRWQGMDDEQILHLKVTVGMEDPLNTDLVILCVKAYQTESAILELVQVNYQGPILTLQNGVGNVETILSHMPDAKIIAGITSEGATLIDIDHVRHAGKGETSFGSVKSDHPEDSFLNKLSKLFNDAGIKTGIASEVDNLIWGKLLINVGINALTAILRIRNGQLLEIQPVRDLMSDLVIEAYSVIEAKGVTLPYPDPVSRVEEVCRMTADNISSMHQDILRGSRTEIDYINQAIYSEGKSLGIPCPLNRTMALLIQGLEHSIQSQDSP
ncbi:MAG: 2-dehydropantoate 2-reductase [Spirochaetota bacterium]|nr:2-dehydropantoate 2-reductase [Spirochaetota bacterium]